MTLTATIAPKELERQAKAVFESRAVRVWLVNNEDFLSLEQDSATWYDNRLTGAEVIEGTIGFGSYNDARQRYEMPPVVCTFTATSGALTYDTVAVQVDGHTYLHSIQVEDPAITLNAGDYRTYLITLAQDDGPNDLVPIVLVAGTGAFAMAGRPSDGIKEFPEDSQKAMGGLVRFTGMEAVLEKDFPLSTEKAVPGHYRLAGEAAGYTYIQKAWQGEFRISGNATLFWNSGPEAGDFSLSGGDATLSQFV